MIINFFPNDGCAIVYCTSRISLLAIKSIFLQKNNHHYFILKLHDTKGGDICCCCFVEKTIIITC